MPDTMPANAGDARYRMQDARFRIQDRKIKSKREGTDFI
jgi:hypothetical protein